MLKKLLPISILISFTLVSYGCAQSQSEETENEEKETEQVIVEPEEKEAQRSSVKQSEINSGFEWISLSEAEEQAMESGKKILIFGYAEWCTYCLKMRKESFTDVQVQESIEEHFIPVQLNGESEEFVEYQGQKLRARELARYLRLTSYPTHFFVDSDGTIMAGQPGYIEPDVFSSILDYVGTDAINEMGFEEYFESLEDGK